MDVGPVDKHTKQSLEETSHEKWDASGHSVICGVITQATEGFLGNLGRDVFLSRDLGMKDRH